MSNWVTSPSGLANAVPEDLSNLPGINGAKLGAVTSQWKANPPKFQGKAVALKDIADFMKEVMTSDPFGTKDQVPYVSFSHLENGEMIAITQRQMAYIVSNVVMKNSLQGVQDGLSRALAKCTPGHVDPIYALLSLLAVLSQELAGGKDGTVLIANRPRAILHPGWWKKLPNRTSQPINKPLICNKVGNQKSGCTPDDFMTGGTAFQAVTDIAGEEVGGGANLCNKAASQDESLVQFYSEVLAFAFFSDHMLKVPITILGSRRYVNTIEGNRVTNCGVRPDTNWLNDDIGSTRTSVKIGTGDQEESVDVMASSFVAVKSVCSAAVEHHGCDHSSQVNNQCNDQRHHVDDDVDFWFQAFDYSGYHKAIQTAFKGVVRNIGTGPWGSGVWWGDSQIYFMTMMYGTALLEDVCYDYYMYEAFCENGGNQCFVLGKDGCSSCMGMKRAEPAGELDPSNCGTRSYKDIIDGFAGKPASDLYTAMMGVGEPPEQVFDTIEFPHPTTTNRTTTAKPAQRVTV